MSFVIDDGTPESPNSGSSLPALLLNQFTPDEFPFELDRVNIMWTPGVVGVEVGDPFFIFLYEDKDGDVFTGPAVHRATFTDTIQSVGGVVFTSTSFDPVVFEGPGDILVAYSTGIEIIGDWAAIDTDLPHADRSYIVVWDDETVPPPIPNPNGGNGQLNGGNWMVRAFGTVLDVPVMLQSIAVE